MTRTLRLGGELGEKFGKVHRNLHITTVGEAIRYLSANFPGFSSYMNNDKQTMYEVWDGEYNCDVTAEEFSMQGSKDIKITPHIAGAGAAARIVAGIVIIAVAWWNPFGWAAGGAMMTTAYGMGASLVLGGVIELLSPKSSLSSSSTDSSESYLFSGAKNDTQQGAGIYVGYGEMEVGSQVISATITTKDWPVSAT